MFLYFKIGNKGGGHVPKTTTSRQKPRLQRVITGEVTPPRLMIDGRDVRSQPSRQKPRLPEFHESRPHAGGGGLFDETPEEEEEEEGVGSMIRKPNGTEESGVQGGCGF